VTNWNSQKYILRVQNKARENKIKDEAVVDDNRKLLCDRNTLKPLDR